VQADDTLIEVLERLLARSLSIRYPPEAALLGHTILLRRGHPLSPDPVSHPGSEHPGHHLGKKAARGPF